MVLVVTFSSPELILYEGIRRPYVHEYRHNDVYIYQCVNATVNMYINH